MKLLYYLDNETVNMWRIDKTKVFQLGVVNGEEQKKKLLNCTWLNLRTSALGKTLLREWKANIHAGSIYLQITSGKTLCFQNINSQSLIIRQQWK